MDTQLSDVIAALVELQKVDDEVRVFTLQRDELASNLEQLRAILERMKTELQDKREKLTEATRFFEEKQIDLQSDGDRLSRAKQKLATVTRTKEYAAMQRELDNLRKKYSEDEAELKRLGEAITEYKSSIADQESKLAELQSEVDREESASADRLGELEGRISEISTAKKGYIARIPKSIHRRYARLLDRREGRAVVPTLANGQCDGCQMRVPPQTYILVQRGERLQTCPYCQRYLYEPSFFEDAPPGEG